jgi:peptidoglycan hydrolase-like protein with peptidoglycan-binding domain
MAGSTRKSMLLASAVALLAAPAFAQAPGDAAPLERPQAEQPAAAGATAADPAPLGAEAAAETAPEAAPETARVDAEPADIRQIQEALSAAGHDAGTVDGIWGPRSRGALAAFQEARGLPGSGNLNTEALEALGLTELATRFEAQLGTDAAPAPTAAPAAPGAAPAPMAVEPAPADPAAATQPGAALDAAPGTRPGTGPTGAPEAATPQPPAEAPALDAPGGGATPTDPSGTGSGPN